jgi:hypothetical protein
MTRLSNLIPHNDIDHCGWQIHKSITPGATAQQIRDISESKMALKEFERFVNDQDFGLGFAEQWRLV